MYMTEAQANEKWCPMIQVAGKDQNIGFTNRAESQVILDDTKCIASGCMWWMDRGGEQGYCGAIKS